MQTQNSTIRTDGETRPSLLLSFDFEDWHQLVHRRLGVSDWDRPGRAFERQLRAVFGLLDELEAKATFFLLGMSAKNYPHVVEEIAARGDEVACHGYAHRRVYDQTPEEFRRDVESSVELIEKISGRRPLGYRAPAFSINQDTPWAYEILAELGFRYDSSRHDSPRIRRRIRAGPGKPHRLQLPSGRELWEFPIAVWRIGKRSLPIGGGAYWRVLPAPVLAHALRRVAETNSHPVLYFHPYECDPHPLQALLPPEPAARQRLLAAFKSLQRNPGRTRVVPRIRKIARHFRFVTYEEACADIDERQRARPRAL